MNLSRIHRWECGRRREVKLLAAKIHKRRYDQKLPALGGNERRPEHGRMLNEGAINARLRRRKT